MEKNIIKIQRCYRIHLLSKIFNNFDNFYLNETTTFENYTIKIRDIKLLKIINKIIFTLNKLCNKNYKINPRVILTAFLINNFTNEIIGIKDRHLIDNYIIEWSNKLVKIFKKETNIVKYQLMIKYLDNYNKVFHNWKSIDKNRTIQNIIISYGNRMEHINYIKENNINENINILNHECYKLLNSIKIIEPSFDIENLKENYKEIINQIKLYMDKIFNDININFKKAYKDILIEEFKNDNCQIILNLINETNEKIVILSPLKYKNSIKLKLLSFNCKDNLINNNYKDLIKYIRFLTDTIIVYSAPEDNNDDWIKNINRLYSEPNIEYFKLIPSLLIEINLQIDIIINKINKLI